MQSGQSSCGACPNGKFAAADGAVQCTVQPPLLAVPAFNSKSIVLTVNNQALRTAGKLLPPRID